MDIVVYGNESELEKIGHILKNHTLLAFRQMQYSFFDNYDDYVRKLKRKEHNVVIVSADGAAGMEGVIAAKNVLPEAKIFWFSDDKAFGPQSYRLECTYFSEKPITAEKIDSAFRQCTV